jgi:hypothetical protein
MSIQGLVSRVSPVQTALRNCMRDEGRPFEFGNQVLISSHRKQLSSKSDGGERCRHVGTKIPTGKVERGERKRAPSGRLIGRKTGERGLDPPKGHMYSAISWKVKSVEPAGAAGSGSMPKSRGRKPKKPCAPTKGAPKQLIAHNTPPREPPIPTQTVQQQPSVPPQTVQQESSIPRQTSFQSIVKSVKRAWIHLVTQRGSFT